jgi:hypothetical protein
MTTTQQRRKSGVTLTGERWKQLLSLMIDDDKAQFGLHKARLPCTGEERKKERERETVETPSIRKEEKELENIKKCGKNFHSLFSLNGGS